MPSVTRVTVRILEDKLLDGIQNILVKEGENYLYTAFTALATNLAKAITGINSEIDRSAVTVAESLRTEICLLYTSPSPRD